MTDEDRKTMTLECGDCGNVYGRWRSACPACGTLTPERERHDYVPASERRAARRQARRATRPDDCIACQRRKAKAKCPHCNEPIHRECLRLHADDCARFQVTLREACDRLAEKKANPLLTPAEVTAFVRQRLMNEGKV